MAKITIDYCSKYNSYNGEKVTAVDAVINSDFFKDGEMVIKKGKKTFLKIIID